MELTKKKIALIIFSLFLLLISVALTFYYLTKDNKTTIISPFVGSNFWPFNNDKIKVIGFLPYWNIKDDYQINYDSLDTLIYFDLLVDNDGSILHSTNGEMEPGWRNFKSDKVQQVLKDAKKKRKKIGISLAAFDEEVLLGVTEDSSKQQVLINEILSLIDDYKFDHINIDFEYFPENEDLEFGRNFNIFLDSLRKAIKLKNENIILSVDIYAKAIIKDTPYRVKEMSAIADEVILMAYDFSNILSKKSGPVAPLKTDQEDEYSIMQTFEAGFGKITNDKLVFAMPLYGYEWLTKDLSYRSKVIPKTGQTASYRRVKELINDRDLQVNWDATSSSPWVGFEDEDGDIHQIFYEDLESLRLKIQLAQQLELKGIAFWALGYEGNNKEIWKLIKQ